MDVIGKERDQFIQSLKGLCIFCVVLIHLPLGNEEFSVLSAGLWISIRKIINFAVAIFFFISAYYSKSYEHLKSYGINNYFRVRLKRLLFPYFFWSIIYIFIKPKIRNGYVESDWLFLLITGKGPLYFLLTLTQFTLITPFLQKYKENKILNIIFVMITPAYMIFYYHYNITHGYEFKPEQLFLFPWFICYYIGLKAQSNKIRLKIGSMSILSIMSLVGFVLVISIIESFYIYSNTKIYSFSISQITIGSILYSICFITFIINNWHNNHNNKQNFLSRIGDVSMGIFLMHPVFNWIYKFIIIHLPYGDIFYFCEIGQLISHVIIWILSVLTSFYVCNYISKKWPPLIKYLGLK